MKKYTLWSIIFFMTLFSNCKSIKESNLSTYEELTVKTYLNFDYPNKIKTNGVALIQYPDNKYFIDYLNNNNLSSKGFKPDISIETFKNVFDSSQVSNFINQLKSTDFNFDKIRFNNQKIKTFDELKKNFKQYDYYKVYVSVPMYSIDEKFALVFSSSGDYTLLNLLKFKDKSWTYISQVNLVFPSQ